MVCKALVVINVVKDNSSTLYDNEIFRANINLCKINDGVVGSFVIRWFMENFAKAANFKFECPFYKVNYKQNIIIQ